MSKVGQTPTVYPPAPRPPCSDLGIFSIGHFQFSPQSISFTGKRTTSSSQTTFERWKRHLPENTYLRPRKTWNSKCKRPYWFILQFQSGAEWQYSVKLKQCLWWKEMIRAGSHHKGQQAFIYGDILFSLTIWWTEKKCLFSGMSLRKVLHNKSDKI